MWPCTATPGREGWECLLQDMHYRDMNHIPLTQLRCSVCDVSLTRLPSRRLPKSARDLALSWADRHETPLPVSNRRVSRFSSLLCPEEPKSNVTCRIFLFQSCAALASCLDGGSSVTLRKKASTSLTLIEIRGILLAREGSLTIAHEQCSG